MNRCFRFVLLLTLFLTCSVCEAAEPPIWAEPVLERPFDTAPLRPIRLPKWVEENVGVGYTLSGMDFAARQEAAKHGVRLSEVGFVDPFYPYYDSKLLMKRSPHVPLGNIEKDLAEYRRLGVRVLGVYPPTLQGEVYEKHPDWRRIPTNATAIPQVDMKQHPYGGMLCLLGPYGDFFVDVLSEIATRHPDCTAFSFDGLHYAGVCYCEHCRRNFRRETGKEIPNADLEDPAFRRYQHWADRRMEDVVRRAQQRLKSIRPDIALVTWTTNAGRFGHFLSVPRNMPTRMNLLLDAPDEELWLDETNRGNSIVPAFGVAYAWAVTNHRVAYSEPYLMSHGNPYGKDSFPESEILRRMLLCVAHGVGPSIAVAQSKRLQAGVYRCLDEVQRRKAWITYKQPEPWAALVMSDDTKNFYGRSAGRVEQRYLAHPFGAFRTCMEAHLPVALIDDWNVTKQDLAKYKLLILANTACIDEKQAAAIRDYVRNGGGLLASVDASLFNEFGDPRGDFLLADVFGVDYRGIATTAPTKGEVDVNFAKAITPDYWEKRTNVVDIRFAANTILRTSKLNEYVGDELVTFKGPAVRVAPRKGARVLATMQPKNSPGEPLAAVVANDFGKGRVVYFASGMDAAYYSYPYPYQRLALESAIRWAARIEPPVEVAAPMCVQSNVMRQRKDGAERLIVHLYNNVNTTGGHAMPVDDVPLREETLPIHEIRVEFRDGSAIERVHLEPEGLPLPMLRKGNRISVLVPRLGIHSMVVAELRSGK